MSTVMASMLMYIGRKYLRYSLLHHGRSLRRNVSLCWQAWGYAMYIRPITSWRKKACEVKPVAHRMKKAKFCKAQKVPVVLQSHASADMQQHAKSALEAHKVSDSRMIPWQVTLLTLQLTKSLLRATSCTG